MSTPRRLQTLIEGRIRAAAVDITYPEPLPPDPPLLKLDNVIFTPHLRNGTEETRRRLAKVSVENLMAGFDGRPLRFQAS